MCAASTDLAAGIKELQNVAEFIARKLEEMILKGQLEPGQHLVQTDIAAQFGVSRLPVRDALKLLETRELAVTLPRRGVIVRPLDAKEVNDLFELRLLLEGYAFDRSVRNFSAADIAAAEAIIQRQEALPNEDFLALLDTDEKFHVLLCSRCENEEIKRDIARIWNRIRVLRALARDFRDWKTESAASHRLILGAVVKQDYEQARAFLETGIREARSKIAEKVSSAVDNGSASSGSAST